MLANKLLELKKQILAEASLVEKMVATSFDAIYQDDTTSLDNVMTFEKRVNQLEIEIENHCITLIALFQPEAKDLRKILMIYKINNDLERLGDQAVNIAESATVLGGNPILCEFPELVAMKEKTLLMLKHAINAFINEDVVLARQVCHDDVDVDNYNRHIAEHLTRSMQALPHMIGNLLHLLRIAKNLERIADLSTNISENTIYLTEGRVIKHHADESAHPND